MAQKQKGVADAMIEARREVRCGFDQRAGHFRPPGLVEGITKLSVLQGLRCFYLGPSSAGVAGAMIKAYAVCGGRAMFLNL